MVMINFIRDSNVGIFARAKRPPRVAKTIPPAVELDGGCADEGALVSQPQSEQPDGDVVRRRK